MKIFLRAERPELMPKYQSRWAAGADLMSRFSMIIGPMSRSRIQTGVYLDQERLKSYLDSYKASREIKRIPHLEVRLRSGISDRTGLMQTNGVGTIDLDYPGEICVLAYNPTSQSIQIDAGMRIAQIIQVEADYIGDLEVSDHERTGGFGSTGA